MTKRTTKANETDPVLYEPPVVTIEGREFTLRRLGLQDVFRVSRILGRGVAVMADVQNVSPGVVAQVLITSMSQNEKEVMELLADLLGVEQRELRDPERFPMHAIVTVVRALAEHQDLRSFLTSLQTLTESSQEIQTRSAASSNS